MKSPLIAKSIDSFVQDIFQIQYPQTYSVIISRKFDLTTEMEVNHNYLFANAVCFVLLLQSQSGTENICYERCYRIC